jgi:hypothetical protein
MGWYIRKSKNFGPFRLNLSKSGIGFSVGVKGARIGEGPKGSYVHLGTGGIYYRKHFSTQSAATASQDSTSSTIELHSFDTTASDLDGHFRRAFRSHIGAAECLGWIIVFFFAVNLYQTGSHLFWGVFAAAAAVALVLGWINRQLNTLHLNYDLDDEATRNYEALKNRVAGIGGIWRVIQQQEAYGSKARLSTTVTREDASIIQAGLPCTKTNVTPVTLKLKSGRFIFLPDRILIEEVGEVRSAEYCDVRIAVGTTRFVESSGRVPPGGTIVDVTWQHARVDGGPDRRYNQNRQFPVMLYGECTLSAAGMNLQVMTANSNAPMALRDAISGYGLTLPAKSPIAGNAIPEETPRHFVQNLSPLQPALPWLLLLCAIVSHSVMRTKEGVQSPTNPALSHQDIPAPLTLQRSLGNTKNDAATDRAELATQRETALAELRQRETNEKAFKLNRRDCLRAVEADSGHRKNAPGTYWLITDNFTPMHYYFTYDDPKEKRLFTSFNYECSIVGNKAVATLTDRRVEMKN